jgi:hypothetical protein
MYSANEQIQVEFHTQATVQFFSIYHAFEDAVSNISRRNEEHKFQELKKHYAAAMEQELEVMAKKVLSKYKDEKQVKEVNQMLHGFIRDYLHRFIQKVNDL